MNIRNIITPTLVLTCISCLPKAGHLTNRSAVMSAESTVYCAVPKMPDYDSHLNDPVQQAALEQALKDSNLLSDGKDIVGTASPEALKRWILFTLTPLSMGCKNYAKGGAQKYGADAFAGFVKTAITAMRKVSSGGVVPIKYGMFEWAGKSEKQKEFIGTLQAINRRIAGDDKAKFRVAGEEVIHGSPLTPAEEKNMVEISKEGLLKVVTYNEPFKNAYGEMVSGNFLSYPLGADVSKHISTLAATYEKSLSKSAAEFQDDAAKIMRRCITIHPFHDANGRTCTLIALWMQAQRKLSHAVIWSGEDILLQENEFVQRFRDGIQFHEGVKKSLQ
jgi:hypothetical protein